MPRRLFPIAAITGILFVVALVGYLIPSPAANPPVRILLENKGGRVIFAHKAHVDDEGGECGVCHHTTGENPSPPPCTACHVKKFDKAFAAKHQTEMDDRLCAACHHPGATIGEFSHAKHAEEYADDCRTCHHDKSIEPEPRACGDCHKDTAEGKKPDLRTAAHQRCADCHEDFYRTDAAGCDRCHTRDKTAKTEPRACSACHEQPADRLVPTTMAAFHGRCMGCHKRQDAGPFGDAACGQCHMK